MASRDAALFEALSAVEMAEQEKRQGGSLYAARRAARQALTLVQDAAADHPLYREVVARAGRLMAQP